jgi:hypothetical protein
VRQPNDPKELRLLAREPEHPPAPPPAEVEEMDAAESRWDPWLVALAKMEIAESQPPAN